jgi:N-glycosylase/DNA lyase
MKSLINKIRSLQKSKVNNIVNKRLKDFESFTSKSNEEWHSELCFCILAANARQKTSEQIQNQLSIKIIKSLSHTQLAELIKKNKHRFHNNKSRYLKESTKFHNIKDIIKKQSNPREWLVKNIKGIGYKEASHFLRNTGTKNIAILDRHILSLLKNHNIIPDVPISLNQNIYFNYEQKFINLANQLNMPPAKLDLFMWYLKTGEVKK